MILIALGDEYNSPSNYVKSQQYYAIGSDAIKYNSPSNYVKSQPVKTAPGTLI